VSFLIDESGKIARIWDPVKAAEHNEEVLRFLSEN
jgi:peroxiredoxin